MFDQNHGMEQEQSSGAPRSGTGPDPQSLSRLIAAGLSDARCGERFGLSKYAIRRLRRRWGIAARLNQPADRPSGVDPFALRWRDGNLTEDQVSGLYGQRRYGRALRAR